MIDQGAATEASRQIQKQLVLVHFCVPLQIPPEKFLKLFDGQIDAATDWLWFEEPQLGYVRPAEMLLLEKYEKLRGFILNKLKESGIDE